MKLRIFLTSLLLITSNFAQDSKIMNFVDQVKLENLTRHVRILSGEDSVILDDSKYLIKNRTHNQPGNGIAAKYLIKELNKYDFTVTENDFDQSGKNIIATQLGSSFPNDIYIICAHYDAVAAYCADDNASSCAALLEVARILSSQNIDNTIIYAFWDKEEIGLIGSRNYAQEAFNTSMTIKSLVNLEMLGWDENDDGKFDIHVRNINESLALGDLVSRSAKDYQLNLDPVIINPGVTSSDHGPFWDNDYTAIVFGESFFGGDGNPHYHKSSDRIDKFNLPYFQNLSKLAVVVSGHLAFYGLNNTVSVEDGQVELSEFTLTQNFPNPFNPSTVIEYSIPDASSISSIWVKLKIYDLLGRELQILVDQQQSPGKYKVVFDASKLSSGTYLYTLSAGKFITSKKMVFIK